MIAFNLALFTTAFGLALGAATTTNVAATDAELITQDLGNSKLRNFSFYACRHAHWQGDCRWFQWYGTDNSCLPLDGYWERMISSFGPDSGHACRLHNDYYCKSMAFEIPYPGVDDLLSVVRGEFNDYARSISCYKV
ncbi:hypothetical protein BJ508DRAFT_303757 [Ascobolus immersus RN42]|uniref:Beta/gamma crystallin 'Greek key' domain-containing protein n=1 Tax=Ascobolus immersus RN42 TaxID=1160509 RepID=A0A3N4IEW2_ASCIM|nr:hypothetical protein BJ508DRAFT_303757 [Ascobolus immersus RN42]